MEQGLFEMIGQELSAVFILSVLAIMSFIAWGIIWTKWNYFRSSKKENQLFLKSWKRLGNLQEMVQEFNNLPNSALKKVTEEVIEEYRHLEGDFKIESLSHRVALLEEAVQRAVEHRQWEDERMLSFLSVSTSLAPFLGLLGTVWGIMKSFFSIGASGSAELSVVAPGIAAALITTVGGLLVAIPTSAGLNYFRSRNRALEVVYWNFGSELVGLIRRADLKSIQGSNREA